MPHKDAEARRLYNAAYYAAHKEKCIAQANTWRAIHPEKAKQYATTSAQRNKIAIRLRKRRAAARERIQYPEKVRERDMRYRSSHPERLRTRLYKWRRENPDKANAVYARRRARKASAPSNDLTTTQWVAIKNHFGHCCVYCGRHMQRLTQDHVIPLAKGGSHTASNIVPACQSCNSKKGVGPPLKPVQPLMFLGKDLCA